MNKRWRQRIFSVCTTAAMVSSLMPMVQATEADSTYKVGDSSPIFCQFYAQNQSGNWDWMSAGGQNLTVGETTTLEFSALDDDNNSKFAVATEDAAFGFQFGDSKIIAGDSSSVDLTIDEIIIKADGYEDLVIDPKQKDYKVDYLAEEVSWGVQGNTTSIDLKDYLGDDFLPYLKAITSFEAKVTLNGYTYKGQAPKEEEKVEGENPYKKGDESELFTQFYLQQNGGDWSWYSPGSEKLIYGEENTFKFDTVDAEGNSVFANAENDYLFGLQFGDSKLKDGDRSIFKANVKEIVMKATGYDDIVINLDSPDFDVDYIAQEMSWGMQGNTTMISLKDYVPGDFSEYVKAITSLEVTLSCDDYTYVAKPADEPEFPEDYKHPTEMRGLTAKELVKDMKLGWNLGNTLESLGGETAWGNPKTTRKMIDAIKAAGFNTVRVPVTWDNGADENGVIDEEYMDRIETVVNYALTNNMYVILNVHHSTTGWYYTTPELEDAAAARYAKYWEQIGARFSDYGDQLIFETMNEPRSNEDDWTGDKTAYDIVNHYNRSALAAIRKSGGNNADRLVMFPPYAASSNYAGIEALEIPDDDMVAVSIHAYLPYSFAMDTSSTSKTTWGSDSDKKELQNVFKSLDEMFLSKDIPVVIGEFASTNKNNTADRVTHAKYYAQLCKSYDMPCVWWDNGAGEANTTDAMGLFDRRRLKWVYPDIIKALVEGYNGESIDVIDSSVIFDGEATSTGWGQALSLTPDKDIMLKDLTEGMNIAVKYESESKPELVLQSWSGGPSWVKVAPARVENGVAYFRYEDMVEAYAKELEEPSEEPFPSLDQIHIGDTGSDLTITKVYLKETEDPTLIYKGEGTCTSWGQALTFIPGTDIMMNKLGKNVKIAVKYEGEEAPEIILQSWSGGAGWAKAQAAEVKDGVAYFRYEDMVKAYAEGTENYESYGEAFPCLNKVYIGAQNSDLKVTKVNYVFPIRVEDASFNTLPTLYQGDTVDLNDYLVITPDNATDKEVSKWSSSNEKVAKVDENGNLVALKPGYTTITAKLDDNDMEVTYDLEVAIKFEAECNIGSDWGTGVNGELVFTNTQTTPINDWIVEFDYDGEISSIWYGEIVSHEGSHYVIKNLGWNKEIPAGGTITVGFTANYEGDAPTPANYKFLNPEKKDTEVTYDVALDVKNTWDGNFTGEIQITNTSEETISNWSLDAEITGNVTQTWGGTVQSQDGNKYTFTNADYNKEIAPGETVTIGVSGTTNGEVELVSYALNF